MEKIKVYLQYPWKFPDSPYYKYLVENPPRNIKYINAQKQKGVITKKKKFFLSNLAKKTIRSTLKWSSFPLPNAHLTRKKEDYDLIHCAHCLSLNTSPWVADMESSWQFWISGKETKAMKKIVKKILLDKNCKKIMAWTKSTKKNILRLFPEIKEKVVVVYPGVPIKDVKKIKHKGINLLFISRYFYEKGGLHALKTIDSLTKRYNNVSGLFVSQTPEEIKNRYSSNKKIKFFDLMPQKELYRNIYSIADIFVYPGYTDSFGFSIIEAMSFGIPVITVEGFARDELVDDGKTGFIVKSPKRFDIKSMGGGGEEIVRGLIKKTSLLIKNKRLKNKIAENSLEEIKNGKFSIKRRNKEIRKIYEEALK